MVQEKYLFHYITGMMELWLETLNSQAVDRAQLLGVLYGVVTTPTLAAKSKIAFEDVLENLLQAQSGPVTAHVVSSKSKEMMEQGEAFHALSNRIIVKIPILREGLHAIHALTKKGIPVMATMAFNANQVLLAARAGATYIASPYSQVCEEEMEGSQVIRSMVHLLRAYGYPAKLLVSSLHTTEQVRECCESGIDGIVIGEKVFEEYIEDHPLAVKAMNSFGRDWKSAVARKVLPF